MFDKFGYSGTEFNPSADFARGHLITLRSVGGDLVFDLCREGEIPAGVVHSVKEGQPLWTIFQESSFCVVKLGADVPVLARLKCVGDGLAGVAGPSDYSFGKTFAAGVSGLYVAVALQSDIGLSGGRYRRREVVRFFDSILLRGGSGSVTVDRPPAGHVYESLDFDFLAGIGSSATDLTRETWTGSQNYTHGRVVMNGNYDRPFTDCRSWYTSYWAGTNSRTLSGSSTPTTAGEVYGGELTVGVVDKGLDTFLWNIQYVYDETHILFRQRGTSEGTDSNSPLLLAGMVSAVIVPE